MVDLVAGDILLSEAELIVIDISPEEGFRAGIAKAVADKWPAIRADFARHRARHPVLPGTVWTWKAPDGRHVAAAVTREVGDGRRTGAAHVSYVDCALGHLRGLVARRRPKSVAVARLGAGPGGLPWGDVETHIQAQLRDCRMPVALYDRHRPGVRARGA